MTEKRCRPEEAFAILRTASQHRNLKLRQVATGVVRAVSGHPTEAGPFHPRHRQAFPNPAGTTDAPDG